MFWIVLVVFGFPLVYVIIESTKKDSRRKRELEEIQRRLERKSGKTSGERKDDKENDGSGPGSWV